MTVISPLDVLEKAADVMYAARDDCQDPMADVHPRLLQFLFACRRDLIGEAFWPRGSEGDDVEDAADLVQSASGVTREIETRGPTADKFVQMLVDADGTAVAMDHRVLPAHGDVRLDQACNKDVGCAQTRVQVANQTLTQLLGGIWLKVCYTVLRTVHCQSCMMRWPGSPSSLKPRDLSAGGPPQSQQLARKLMRICDRCRRRRLCQGTSPVALQA